MEVRRFIDELGPTALADTDLVTALEELVAHYREAGLAVTLTRPEALPTLEPNAEIVVYRVASEALRNVLRHAAARACRVTLKVDGADVVLEVVDDGVGLQGQPEGVGRRAMAHRVTDLGGELFLSEPDEGGVHVNARLPEVDPMIRVLVADDHPLFLDGLRTLLDSSPGLEVVGAAADGEGLLRTVEVTEFDVAVVDLDMPGVDGATATRELLQMRPEAAVLVLTMHDDAASVHRALPPEPAAMC